MANPIICGPIVRKVTSSSVSVFIALNEFRRVKLQLYYDPAGSQLIGETENDPRRIGEKLWVIVITLKNLSLDPGQNYHYNLSLYNGLDGSTENLASLGFLQANNPILGHPLGYEANNLPGFALPPKLANLKIMHGSCRKPHGHGPDKLAHLDELIAANHHDPLSRPHQLFLTGDQIYADDVGRDLFELLTEEGLQLLGIPEPVTHSVKHGDVETQTVNRKRFIETKTKLTSDHNDCHLVYLSEFYCMYLFAWSGYPLSLEDLRKEHIFPPRVEKEWDMETWRSETINIITDLTIYARTLPQVRRALANIPVYMMFDDHEVTDDWYIDGKWKVTTLGHDTTRRIIRNGLIAYAVFQDWGNQPEKYEEDQSVFWQAVEYRDNGASASINTFEAGPEADQLYSYLGLDPDDTSLLHNWFYQLSFEDHNVFVLDSRTRRQYHDPYTQLIGEDDFEFQLPASGNTDKTAIVIALAPILGMSLIEEAQRLLVKQAKRLKATALDDEAWIGDPLTFNLLLSHLAEFKQVVVLSGDVHYGFTNTCSFFKHTSQESARILQLCASSLRNGGIMSDLPTRIDHKLKEECFAIYKAEDVDDVKVKIIRIRKQFFTPVLDSFLTLNPRPGSIKAISYPDLREWQSDLEAAMNIHNAIESYAINYLDHELTAKYQPQAAFNPEEDKKIVGNTNIGEVTFKKVGSQTFVVHQMHILSGPQKRIFLCETALTPPPATERPVL